ncbi:acyltransferase family protein [Pseudomonas hunanensis]|uniref:acyltransferase family protein n=1 Tax=Pseudomonas hunanensis TaxID=1247546 RepID=UPI0015B8146A
MLLGIHYLRGIAALIVVLFHFRGILNNVYSDPNLGKNLLQAGASGVDIFFMISGFIIVIATQNAKSNTPSAFLLRRVFRIYPALVLCWLVGCFTVYSNQPLFELLKSVIPVNRDYNLPPPTFGFNLMGPPWTLTYEILFYLVFCLALSLSHKYRALIASLMMILSVTIINLVFNGSVELSANTPLMIESTSQWAGVLRMISSSYLLEFIVGMGLAHFYLDKRIIIQKHAGMGFFLACLAIFLVMFTSNYNPGFGPQGYGVWAIILVSGVIVLEKAKVEIGYNSIASYLGDISYSMYISHYLILKLLQKHSPLLWGSTSGFSRFLFAVFITIAVASVIHYFVEKPFISIGKRVLERAKQRESALVSAA